MLSTGLLVSLSMMSCYSEKSRWYDMGFATESKEQWQDFMETVFDGVVHEGMSSNGFSNEWRNPRVLFSIKIQSNDHCPAFGAADLLFEMKKGPRRPIRIFSVGPPEDKKIVIFKRKAFEKGVPRRRGDESRIIWTLGWLSMGRIRVRRYNVIRCMSRSDGQSIASASNYIKQFTKWESDQLQRKVTVEALMNSPGKRGRTNTCDVMGGWELNFRGSAEQFQFGVDGVDVQWQYEILG